MNQEFQQNNDRCKCQKCLKRTSCKNNRHVDLCDCEDFHRINVAGLRNKLNRKLKRCQNCEFDMRTVAGSKKRGKTHHLGIDFIDLKERNGNIVTVLRDKIDNINWLCRKCECDEWRARHCDCHKHHDCDCHKHREDDCRKYDDCDCRKHHDDDCQKHNDCDCHKHHDDDCRKHNDCDCRKHHDDDCQKHNDCDCRKHRDDDCRKHDDCDCHKHHGDDCRKHDDCDCRKHRHAD